MQKTQALIISLLIHLFSPSLFAQSSIDAEQEQQTNQGVELLKKVDELYRSESSTAIMSMQIVTANWSRTLEMQAWSIGMDDTFIRILSPKKDRGVATLKIGREMWNYFPKINKVIKVPPSMMMGSWMGSDFTNDDLVRESSLVQEYNVALDDDAEHHQLTLLPKQQTATVWGKIEVLIDKVSLLPIEQSYFNERGEKIRVMRFSDIKRFSGRDIPATMTMTPLNKPGQKTVVHYQQLELDVEIDEDVFTLRNLKKRVH